MLRQIRCKAQSLTEYLFILFIIAAAYIGASNYIKRGLQGRWKQAVDDLGEQYDPRFADTNVRHTVAGITKTSIQTIPDTNGYWTRRTDESNVVEARTGSMVIGGF